jgi:hypothetical protein
MESALMLNHTLQEFHRADWVRGEVIRRLNAERAYFGLLHFVPELGKTY